LPKAATKAQKKELEAAQKTVKNNKAIEKTVNTSVNFTKNLVERKYQN